MLNKKVIISLIKAIKAKGEKIENKIEDERLVKYVFNDISAVFSIKDGKETFFGMIFPLFGNDVLVSEDLELVSYNEELDDGLIIEDKKFLELVNQYLILRVLTVSATMALARFTASAISGKKMSRGRRKINVKKLLGTKYWLPDIHSNKWR